MGEKQEWNEGDSVAASQQFDIADEEQRERGHGSEKWWGYYTNVIILYIYVYKLLYLKGVLVVLADGQHVSVREIKGSRFLSDLEP